MHLQMIGSWLHFFCLFQYMAQQLSMWVQCDSLFLSHYLIRFLISFFSQILSEGITQMPNQQEQDRKQALPCKHEKVSKSTGSPGKTNIRSPQSCVSDGCIASRLSSQGARANNDRDGKPLTQEGSTVLWKKIYHVKQVIVLQAVLLRMVVKVRVSPGQWSLITTLHKRSFLLITTIAIQMLTELERH